MGGMEDLFLAGARATGCNQLGHCQHHQHRAHMEGCNGYPISPGEPIQDQIRSIEEQVASKPYKFLFFAYVLLTQVSPLSFFLTLWNMFRWLRVMNAVF